VTGRDLAQAALALVGTPFRLHGRDPVHGLDCVGLIEAALRECGIAAHLPFDYALRNRSMPELGPITAILGLKRARGAVRRGDVLLLRISACQYHFAIAVDGDLAVHAHAGLGRVVCGPLLPEWTPCSRWRLTRTRS